MKFVPMLELIKKAAAGGYAVPSFCVWNAESMLTVLNAAEKLDAPVILMNGFSEFSLLNPYVLSSLAHALPLKTTIPAALHLDHGKSLEQVKVCIDAGYTSVMLDFSHKPFSENVEALRKVVEIARPLGVTVEGEIGSVGKIHDDTVEGEQVSILTDPEEALAFVNATGVDVLAVSIGNAHGNYISLPRLRFDLLEDIYSKVRIPLVLHGGSGTPDKEIKKAISLGIAKINIASELICAVRESLKRQWNMGKNPWVSTALVGAMRDMGEVVEKWILRVGAAGQA